MILNTVSADTTRAAQMATGVALAIWIGVGIVPAWQNRAHAVRSAVLALYLLGCLGFIGYVVLGSG